MNKSIPKKMCQKEALYSMILSKNIENFMKFILFTEWATFPFITTSFALVVLVITILYSL